MASGVLLEHPRCMHMPDHRMSTAARSAPLRQYLTSRARDTVRSSANICEVGVVNQRCVATEHSCAFALNVCGMLSQAVRSFAWGLHAAQCSSLRRNVRVRASEDATGPGAAFGPRVCRPKPAPWSLRSFSPIATQWMLLTCQNVALYATSQGAFLVGFTAKDGADVAAWFGSVEPGFPVSHCTHELLPLSLGEALYTDHRNPLADLVKPSADAASASYGAGMSAAAVQSTASEDGAAPSPASSIAADGGGDGGSSTSDSADLDMTGSQRSKGSGMRPVGPDTPQPKQFRVHAYTELLPMPRIAILSGLSEMEWVGICELWDTTGASWRRSCLTCCLHSVVAGVPCTYSPQKSTGFAHVSRPAAAHLCQRDAAHADHSAWQPAGPGRRRVRQQRRRQVRACCDLRAAPGVRHFHLLRS